MRLGGFFLAGALGAALLLGGATTARADDWGRGRDRQCWNRINREEDKLRRDIRRHGIFSRQAQNRRAKLHRLRQQCGGSFWGWRDDRGRGRGRWDHDDDWRWRDRNRNDRWRRDRDDRYWDGRRWRRR
jgi:hypothetical protein